MRIFGILGYPLGHSLSPVMHAAAFRELGVEALYAPFEVSPQQLGVVLRGLRVCGIDGLNVTIPHKTRILRHLDRRTEVADTAVRVGAVNTLVGNGRQLVGHNTDVEGFKQALRHELRLAMRGRRALVLGGGGAARAVAWALADEQAGELYVANRTAAKARALVRCLRQGGWAGSIAVVPFERRRLADALRRVELLVNATSLGLHAGDPLPVDPRGFHSRLAVADLVYRSPTTELVRAARRRGALAMDGVPMLVYQGAESFRLWWDRPAPIAAMRRAVETTIRRSASCR